MPVGLLIPSTQPGVASDPELTAHLKPSRSDQVGMILCLPGSSKEEGGGSAQHADGWMNGATLPSSGHRQT